MHIHTYKHTHTIVIIKKIFSRQGFSVALDVLELVDHAGFKLTETYLSLPP